MNDKNLLYDISDRVPFPKILIYAIQQILSVFVATVLIANICGTPIDSCLFGAGFGTIVYQIITRFKSPMFISSCGATVSAVCGALAIGGSGKNYLAVFVGGVIILAIYGAFALLVKFRGVDAINKIFPPIIVGPVTMVIGLNLATFIPTYVQIGGEDSWIGVAVALATMLVVAISSHYFHGFWKTIPFLVGLVFGYVISLVVTLTGVADIVKLSAFDNMRIFAVPDFAFLHFGENSLTLSDFGQIALLFIPVTICAMLEHYSDHKVLSNIIGTDLTETPGLSKTLFGDGFASMCGTLLCGLPNTSYGESISTTGFSRVASTRVLALAAVIISSISFVYPIQAVIESIPSCVFGGCALILYGYIASSGLKTIVNSKVDLEDNKNLIIVCVVLTAGVSGIWFVSNSFAGTSLAMVVGVVLNILLKNKK